MSQPSNALVDWRTFWNTSGKDEDWLLEPVLPRGRSIAIFAGAKRGKSLLVLDLVARLATGQRCLDRPEGDPVTVVYLDFEMTEDDLRERLYDMGYGPECDLDRLYYYLLPSLPPLDSPQGGAALLDIARSHGAEVVVIDTTSRVLQGAENDADTIRSFYMCTGLPLKSAGITVVRLDHEGKDSSKGQRGSSAKADDVDLVWQLGEIEGGVRLRATHRRQGWIPETVDLLRLAEPLRHERAAIAWPAGTAQLAELLDSLEVPLDWGAKRVRPFLRDLGHAHRNDLIGAALRYRKSSGTPSGTPSLDVSGTPSGDTRQFRFGDTLGDTSGHPAAATGDTGVSLIGDTLSQAPDFDGETAFCGGGCGNLLFPGEPCPDCVEAVV